MAKKEAVQNLFNDIAPKYDALNHILSMNIDKIWRKKAIAYLKSIQIDISKEDVTQDMLSKGEVFKEIASPEIVAQRDNFKGVESLETVAQRGNFKDVESPETVAQRDNFKGVESLEVGSLEDDTLEVGSQMGSKGKTAFMGIDQVRLLDVACGTGDFSLAAARAGVGKITGIDISANMLEVGNEKVAKAGLQQKITLQLGDSENMEFATASFDAVTVAFGVRNFEHLELGLKEIHRVLRPGGKAVILEFSMPERFPMKQLYKFYFCNVLPVVGGWLSGNRGAYNYLPASVLKFPQGETFLGIMKKCGFCAPIQKRLSFGIASIYVGVK